MRARTIQIYLPDGDPRGIRIAELTTSIVRVIEVPRALLSNFQDMPEAEQVGFYFLCGEDDTGALRVYIGQSGCVGKRLDTHNSTKDFWNKALVVVSLTHNMTQTHALFLEWLSIQMAHDSGRYTLENSTMGSKPHTPKPLQADCEDIQDMARTLLATLGFPIFEPIAPQTIAGVVTEKFLCRGMDCDGIGEYTVDGFVVLKGSKGRLAAVASYGLSNEDMRRKLLAQNVVEQKDGALIFLKDHLFRTPSAAAAALLGRTSNGWVDWKTSDGRTLDESNRKKVP